MESTLICSWGGRGRNGGNENVLFWFITSKQVWYLLHLVDKSLRSLVMDKRISIDPKVCHGQACIKGTRIPVHQIIRMLANGDTIEELIEEYPSISREDIFACLDYAASLANQN
jgi:uncharacterized protein (DUF433 family)